jgi:MFS family permease
MLRRPWARRSALTALVGTAAATAALAVSTTAPVAWLLAAAIGVFGGFMEVLAVTVVQEARPDDTATTCGALDSLCYGAVLAGLLVSPVLVSVVGGRGCLYVVGAGLLLLAAAARACAARRPGPDALRTTCRTTAPAV